MTELEQVIQAIEHGLLKVSSSGEIPTKKMDLAKRMQSYKVPGFSAAFIDQDELVWTGAYGLADAKSKKPVTSETIFQAASISKPVTGIIALHLVEDGLLDLDSDVNEVLRTWKVPKSKFTKERSDGTCPRITLRGLLSHTAGMNIFGYPGYPSNSELPTLQQILNGKTPAKSKPVRVAQEPGTGFKYSGGGYLVVQQMIEDVTGMSLAVLAKELIFDKLGMSSSTLEIKLPQATIALAATGHQKNGELVTGKWHFYPEQAAASLWSTPSDLARLIIEVLKSLKNESNFVLSQEMTRQMLVPQIGLGGLGFNVVIKDGMTRFGHPGWNEGFHSIILGCPEVGQGVVWMTNGEKGRSLYRELSRGLAEIVQWSWW